MNTKTPQELHEEWLKASKQVGDDFNRANKKLPKSQNTESSEGIAMYIIWGFFAIMVILAAYFLIDALMIPFK